MSRRNSPSIEAGSSRWAATLTLAAWRPTGSQGSPPKPAPGRAVPLDGGALGVAAVDVDQPVGRDLAVGLADLVAHVDERGAAQGEQQHGRHPGPRLAVAALVVAAGDPGDVVVAEHPGRPGVGRQQPAELVDHRPEGLGLPRLGLEHEVVDQVELVLAGAVVPGQALQVEQVDLADGHAVVVAVEGAPEAAQDLVHLRPVLVPAGDRLQLGPPAVPRLAGSRPGPRRPARPGGCRAARGRGPSCGRRRPGSRRRPGPARSA